ncbi:MAG: VOC family protein [Bdellovibrionales bacterium]
MDPSFRVKNFATIRMSVNDVSRARDWYRKFWHQDPVDDLKDFVSFRIAGVHFDICLADAKSPTSTGGSVGYWLVDDLDKAIAKALELNASIYRGPLKVEEIHRTIVQIKDPHGNVFGLEAEF